VRRLIINADDLGYDAAVDRGLLRAMREGVVTSATLMVNTPFSAEAARTARGLPVGLHLNLARGRPVSEGFPASFLQDGAFSELRASALPAAVVEDEARAQLALAERLLGTRPTHLDVHKHLHRFPGVLEGVARAARAAGLPVRSLDPAMRATLAAHGVPTPDHFVGEALAEPYWTLPRFLDAVDTLEAGLTELMCHPGETPRSVRSGYAGQREVELATLVAPEARAALARANVVLADFRLLAAPQASVQ
jgi:chitin disaccharide deacetylase